MNSDTAKKIASNYLQENVKSVYPIIGKGSVNKIFVVRTDRSEVVIRMNDDRSAYQDYVKERWCMEQAIGKGIPSPDVLAVGKRGDTAYMIQTFIAGNNGEETLLDKSDLWRQIGKYTKWIHSIKVKGFGENLTDPETNTFQAPLHDNFDGTWTSFVQYNIDSLTDDDELIKLGVLNNEKSQKVKNLFEKLLNHKFNFGLIHGDLSLKNTITNEKREVFLLDWGSSEVHIVPHWDIIQMLKCHIVNNNPTTLELNAFLDGYGIDQQGFQSMQHELNTLLLLRTFDKLRWAIDRSPSSIPDYTDYAKRVLRRVVERS
jgi:fructosamine-3-kinase